MTDIAHANLCELRTLIWSRNSYDTQLLCLCRSLSHGHDWVFPFSVGLHTLSTMMCISCDFVDKKWAITWQTIVLLCKFIYSTYYEFPHFIHHKMTTRDSKLNWGSQTPLYTVIEYDDLFAHTIDWTTDYFIYSTTELVRNFKYTGYNLSPVVPLPTTLIHIHLQLFSLITASLFNNA